MKDRKYQTIDPFLLETLNLNEKRINHIFDILHGRDPRPQSNPHLKNNSTHNSSPTTKLPSIFQQHQKIKNPRGHISSAVVRKHKQSRASLSNYSPRNQSVLTNIQQKKQQNNQKSKASPIKQRKSKSFKQSTIPTSEQNNKQTKVDARERLIHDYGMNQIRKNKSLQINPKDVYRVEIQSLISKPTEIQQLQDAQKLMKRLKRRYQHLRKFDKNYYSKLSQSDFIVL